MTRGVLDDSVRCMNSEKQDDKPSDDGTYGQIRFEQSAILGAASKRQRVEPSRGVGNPPTKVPFVEEMERMLKLEGDHFMSKFIDACYAYDHRDVKTCMGLAEKDKYKIMHELNFNVSRQVNIDTFKFTVAIACLVGGKVFKQVPKFVRELQQKSLNAPVVEMLKNVMNLFFPANVVNVLANNVNLIRADTYELIQGLDGCRFGLNAGICKISLELLSLLDQYDGSYDLYIATCCYLSGLKPETIDIFRKAAQKNQKISHRKLSDLVVFLQGY